MWTQWTHVDLDMKRDEWGSNEWKGSNVSGVGKQDHITKIGIFPCSANPKPNGQ